MSKLTAFFSVSLFTPIKQSTFNNNTFSAIKYLNMLKRDEKKLRSLKNKEEYVKIQVE